MHGEPTAAADSTAVRVALWRAMHVQVDPPPHVLEDPACLVYGFTKLFGLRRLVYADRYDDMRLARQRERNMKHWRRAWNVRQIFAQNPGRENLSERLS
jgi:hypothetical protein